MRYWMKSSALNDADDIVSDLIFNKISNKRQGRNSDTRESLDMVKRFQDIHNQLVEIIRDIWPSCASRF